MIDSAPASLDSSPISQREGVRKRKREEEEEEEEEKEIAETDEDYPTPYQECQLKGDSEDAQRVSETESEQSLSMPLLAVSPWLNARKKALER